MIKKIIHTADIHIRRTMDNWEYDMYSEGLTRFIQKCAEIAAPYEKEEVRIVISGDLFHNKNNISNDLDKMATAFIRQLEEIAHVIVIAGNHDFNLNNVDQTNTISTFFETRGFTNTTFLDATLGYRSGIVEDDNVIWALYSIFDDFMSPDLYNIKTDYPNKTVIGLYHDMVVGATLNNGFTIDQGLNDDAFEGCDCVMAGHIHKRQVLRRKGVDIVYPGSLIQQNFGETTTQHGFCTWDVNEDGSLTYEFVDLPTIYGFYNIEVKDIEKIDDDEVTLLNI